MYSIALERISLDEFEHILTTTELTPGRRMLLDGLHANLQCLQQRGTAHLAALQQLLRNKKQYPQLSLELGISQDYLVVLNREVNSYVAKPSPLATLEVFAVDELARLVEAGVKTSKDLYERGLTPSARAELARQTGVTPEQLTRALQLADLLRINGVGPVYARILHEMGITNPAAYAQADSAVILERYNHLNAEKGNPWPRLSLKDVDYCKRFCRYMDADLAW
jgi:nucleotidyltransferase/DNA polymerase involved in DNA repair